MGSKTNDHTLCWNCKWAVGVCSWAKKGEPVKGWVAEPTQVKVYGKRGPYTQSYIVRKCPLYEYG